MSIVNNDSHSVQKFFNVSELASIVLSHLSRDRIDLLQVSLVCKSLRVQALRVWSRHLDIPMSAAIDRYRLFNAHPDLLSEVRFLRIRNDVADRGLYGSTSRYIKRSSWTKLNKLLAMLGERSNLLPLVDITIRPNDRLRLPSSLKQRVVALRILPVSDRLSRIDAEPDSYSDDEDDLEDDGDEPSSKMKQKQQRPSTPESASEPESPTEIEEPEPEPEPASKAAPLTADSDMRSIWAALKASAEKQVKVRERMEAAKEQRGWKELIDIVQQAGNGPGLETFHFGIVECTVGGPPSQQAFQTFWETLVTQHAAHLHDLSINLGSEDVPDAILASLSFAQLEVFNLTCGRQKTAEIDNFLDHTTNLRELYINTPPPFRYHGPLAETQPLSMRQTFPYLRWLQISDPWPAFEDQLAFASRHPGVVGLFDPGFIPLTTTSAPVDLSLPNLIPYPNLKFTAVTKTATLEHFATQGRYLSHIAASFVKFTNRPWSQIESIVSWLAKRDNAAKAVTCLEIWQEFGSLTYSIPHFYSAFNSRYLPNLTELCLVFSDHEGERPFLRAQFEHTLVAAMATLVSASQLRVLRMCDGSRHIEAKELLDGAEFPPSFELFGWLDPPNRVPQYFRFVSTTTNNGNPSIGSETRKRANVGSSSECLQSVAHASRGRVPLLSIFDLLLLSSLLARSFIGSM
ncbi:hypothetical protein CF326_g2056 [Tilletia indica]|nr:hypothetical protein CF326_g2056 [Tilletia indica]